MEINTNRDLKKHQEKLLDFFFLFHDLLEKNNLWYVAEFGTLLGAIREGKMIEWDDDIDLAINYETYLFLKKNYPNNLLDTDIKGYPFLFAKWVPDVDKFLECDIFIDLFILVPTNEKRFKKYCSLPYIMRFANQMFSKGSKYKPQDFVGWLLKVIYWPFQWIIKKITIEKNYQKLFVENSEFVQLIENPIFPIKSIRGDNRTNNVWQRKKIKFYDKMIYVSQDYKYSLEKNYGPNYMTPIMTSRARFHYNAINSTYLKDGDK